MPRANPSKSILLLTISAVAVGAILIGSLVIPILFPPPDNLETGCARTVPGKTVFLIDHSEAITTQTQDAIKKRAGNFIEDEVAEGELVSVFYLNDLAAKKLTPKFQHCKPPKTGNPLYQKRKKIADTFRESFLEPLADALSAPIMGSDTSPIAQAIIDVSLSESLQNTPKATLIIFSDFMENTPALSLYKCQAPGEAIETWKKHNKGATLDATGRPTFKRLRVQAHYIPRRFQPNDSTEAISCRNTFWNWFLGNNAGGSYTPFSLPG